MFELTEERKESLKSFLTNAGTVFLAGLIVGSVRGGRLQLPLFIWGCIIYPLTLLGCWILGGPEKED